MVRTKIRRDWNGGGELAGASDAYSVERTAPILSRLMAGKSATYWESVLAKSVGASPLASDRLELDRPGFGTLRTALVSGVALACLTGLARPADAAPARMGYDAGSGLLIPAAHPAQQAK